MGRILNKDIIYMFEAVTPEVYHYLEEGNKLANELGQEQELLMQIHLHKFINRCLLSQNEWDLEVREKRTPLILDEAIQTIGFIMKRYNLITTQDGFMGIFEYIVESVRKEEVEQEYKNNDVMRRLKDLSKTNIPCLALVKVLNILDYYGFNRYDIIREYSELIKLGECRA